MKTSFPLLAAMALLFAFCDQIAEPVAVSEQESHSAEAGALRRKVELFTKAEEYDSVLAYARKGAEVSEKENDWQEWGTAQTNALTALYFLGRSTEADSLFSGIETTAKAHIHADSAFWGLFFNCVAVISEELGDYEKALLYGHREIEFNEKKGDLNALAVASNNIGVYYRGRGDYDRALDYTKSALGIYLSRPDTNAANLAWTYGNLSKIWYRKKDFPQAIDNARKALDILEQHFKGGKPDDFIIIYNDLANAYIETKQYDTAINYLQQALRLFERPDLRDSPKIALTWHNMGYALRLSGKYDEAAIYLQRAIERYGAKHPNLGKAYRHLGYIDLKKGNLRSALAWQQRALSALTNDSFPQNDILANPKAQRVNAYSDFLFTLRDKGETLRQLAEKESNPQLLEGALAVFDIAAAVLDSMRMEYQEGSREFWNDEARPLMESAIETAFQLYENTRERRYLEQAFRYAEKSKAQLLAEALRESAAKEQVSIPRKLLQEEKELKIAVAFYESQIFSERQKKQPDANKIALWEKETFSKRRQYEALLDTFKESYPAYFQIKYRDAAPTIDTLQQKLSLQTGLLEYFRGERKIYAFYVDKTTAAGFAVTPDRFFTLTFERLLGGLRNRVAVYEKGRSAEAVAQFAQDAAAIFQTLVAPIGKMPEKLIVVPDGDLAYLPFELLLTEKPSSETPYAKLPYLLRQATLHYEYSAGLAMQPPPPLKPQRYFSGYAPSYANNPSSETSRGDSAKCRRVEAADFGPLGNNEEEVKEIAQLLWGQSFTGAEATEMRFKENAAKPRILHLAMHGFLDDCDPLYSGLVFSLNALDATQGAAKDEREGLLYAYEIYNLKLNAELVVLSACNTGLGQLQKGEGVMSLARAFKYAGAPNVLMSLWQAEDHATAQIMERFYLHLKNGAGKDEALRQAKLDYLDANNHNHPFFWGAFVLIGDDKPVTRSSSWTLYLAAGLLAVSLFAAGFYFWKRKNKAKAH